MAPGRPPSPAGLLSPSLPSPPGCSVPVTAPAAVPSPASLFPARCRDLPLTALAAVGRDPRPPTGSAGGSIRPAPAWAWAPGHAERRRERQKQRGCRNPDTQVPLRAGGHPRPAPKRREKRRRARLAPLRTWSLCPVLAVTASRSTCGGPVAVPVPAPPAPRPRRAQNRAGQPLGLRGPTGKRLLSPVRSE